MKEFVEARVYKMVSLYMKLDKLNLVDKSRKRVKFLKSKIVRI